MRMSYEKIREDICCRCECKATHIFKKREFLKRSSLPYCNKHLIERLKKEIIE